MKTLWNSARVRQSQGRKNQDAGWDTCSIAWCHQCSGKRDFKENMSNGVKNETVNNTAFRLLLRNKVVNIQMATSLIHTGKSLQCTSNFHINIQGKHEPAVAQSIWKVTHTWCFQKAHRFCHLEFSVYLSYETMLRDIVKLKRQKPT